MRLGPFFFVGVMLLLIWIVGFLVFHVTDVAIHILIVCALLSFVIHKFWAKEV
jgi:hypothetical protein